MADFFVDLSAATAGAGSFASPWNRLTLITGVTAGVDKVWVRRVTFVDTSVHINWAPPTNVPIIGWPISGDEDYASRPSVAQAAWDGDAGTHAVIDMTDASQNTSANRGIVVPASNATTTLKRLELIWRATSNYNTSWIHAAIYFATITASVIDLYRCRFRFLPVGTFAASGTGNGQCPMYFSVISANTVYNMSARECLFEQSTDFSGLSRTGCVNSETLSDTNNVEMRPGFSDCTFRLSGQSTRDGWFGQSSGGFSRRLNGNFLRCTFESTVARSNTNELLDTANTTTGDSGTVAARPLFTECTFTCATSVSGRASLLHSLGRFVRCSATGFQRLYVGYQAYAHFTSFVQGAPETVYTAAVETAVGGPSVVIDSLVLQPGNTRDISIPANLPATVIVRNITEGTGGYSPAIGNSRIMLANLNGAVGTWKLIASEGSIETSANSRVGGEAFSLILRPTPGGGSFAVQSSATGLRTAWPGEDTLFVSLASGSRTVTVYGYYGGYSVIPTLATVWVTVEYPTSTGLVSVTSKATGALTADSSTWNGFSGGTAFRMALTFAPPVDCVGAVRLTTTAFDTTGAYIAIDPKPVVV